MTFAAAISEHPVPATAVGEVVGHVLERAGEGRGLATLFVTANHAGALEDIAAAVHTLLDPQVLIGVAGSGVVGPGREVEKGPGVALWVGDVGPVEAVRLDVVDTPTGGRAIGGWPIGLGYVPAAAVLLADPFSFPVNTLLTTLNGAGGFPRVVGGLASAGRGPGGNRLVLNGEVHDSGAVGVLIGAADDVRIETVVSQGCRPVGEPFVVTRTEGNVIYELGGESALLRLTNMVKDLSPDDVALAHGGLLIGRVINEHKPAFGPGDFLVRTLIDSDPLAGSITIGEKVEVGTTVQFHLRDADSADADLRRMLEPTGADAALLFSGTGRGSDLFGEFDHDAAVMAETTEDGPVAGFISAGEFAPVSGRNFVHGFSASAALFTGNR